MDGSEHARGIKDQHRVREIASSKDAHASEKLPEGSWQGVQPGEKRSFRTRCDRVFAHQQPETRDGDETRQKRPKKNLPVRMLCEFEQPERGERTCNGTDRIHEALEAERPAIGARQDVRSEECFLGGRPYTPSHPRRYATEE